MQITNKMIHIHILRQTAHTYGDAAIAVIVTHHPAYLLQHPLCKKEALRDLFSRTFGA
jgi:uracil-DNA glycosylase